MPSVLTIVSFFKNHLVLSLFWTEPAVSEYFRTARHHLDIKKCLFRNLEESLTNF